MIAASTLPLDSELRAQGFSPSEQPDFVDRLLCDHTAGAGYSGQPLGNRSLGEVGEHQGEQVTEGTLVVTFVDPATRQEVWRGMASSTIKEKNLHKDVNKSITKLVQRFVKDQAGKK